MKKKRTRPDKHCARLLLTKDELATVQAIMAKLQESPTYAHIRPVYASTAIRFALGRCLAGMDE